VNVSCVSCRTVFRVDPAKVPATGIRARCAVCSSIIDVGPAQSIADDFGGVVATAAGALRGLS
jgi:predicted Zn finger-like uncharacterized protein